MYVCIYIYTYIQKLPACAYIYIHSTSLRVNYCYHELGRKRRGFGLFRFSKARYYLPSLHDLILDRSTYTYIHTSTLRWWIFDRLAVWLSRTWTAQNLAPLSCFWFWPATDSTTYMYREAYRHAYIHTQFISCGVVHLCIALIIGIYVRRGRSLSEVDWRPANPERIFVIMLKIISVRMLN